MNNQSNSNNQELSGSKQAFDEMNNNDNQTIAIHLPEPYETRPPINAIGTVETELIKLNEEEGFAQRSFDALITEQHAKKESYFLARLITCSQDKRFVHYFDAQGLIMYLCDEYPKKFPVSGVDIYNPMTRQLINKLDYFECAPDTKPDNKFFTHMCSHQALCNNNEDNIYQTKFGANQTRNLEPAAKYTANLGYVYEEGRIVTQDYKKAFELYTKAANQELDPASAETANYNLGNLDARGCGVEQNYQKAFELYTNAANQEHSPKLAVSANYNLGLMYTTEHDGVEQNYQKAFEYYTKAANQEHNPKIAIRATYGLGVLHAKGYGVEQNYRKAFECYTKTANQEHNPKIAASATYNLGIMHATEHDGVEQNYQKAFESYTKVANQEHNLAIAASATYSLGVLYEKGHGVEQNYQKAFELYTKAANQKHNLWIAACGNCNLGFLYENGLGVTKDYKKAFEHYTNAQKQTDDLKPHDPAAAAYAQKALARLSSIKE